MEVRTSFKKILRSNFDFLSSSWHNDNPSCAGFIILESIKLVPYTLYYITRCIGNAREKKDVSLFKNRVV